MKINKEKNYLKQLQKKNKEYNRKYPNAYFPFIKQDAGNVEVNNQIFNASVDTTVSGVGTSGGLGEDCLQTDLKNKKRTENTNMKKKLTLKESVFEPISKQFGRWRVEVHTSDWNPSKLSATFYDMAQDKEVFPQGQNTGATYYVDTLLGKDGYGRAISGMPKLSLVGDIPEWTVSHNDLVEIQDWLEEVTKKDLDEGYSNSLIDEVIMHFRGDLGKEPRVEDVLRYIKKVHPEEVPENHDEYDRWEEYITYKISTRLGESLNEASYGGAFDIEDDQYFTKEDIVDLGYNVCDILKENWPKYDYDIENVYMENPHKLYLGILDSNDIELESYFTIDMRKIKKPDDLNRVYLPIIANWFVKKFENEYMYLEESKKGFPVKRV